MTSGIKGRGVEVCVRVAVFLWTASLWTTTAAIAQTIVVDAAPAHVANTFSPVRSLGAAIDRLRTGTPDKLLKDPLLKEILGAGWQTVTYRQNTELMVEAWHWNPAGKWSNADKQEGYFVGNAEPTAEMIHSSWAYPLPHRGFSRRDELLTPPKYQPLSSFAQQILDLDGIGRDTHNPVAPIHDVPFLRQKYILALRKKHRAHAALARKAKEAQGNWSDHHNLGRIRHFRLVFGTRINLPPLLDNAKNIPSIS
jgi:hypothetical protein